MRNSNTCKQCECYLCAKNDGCLNCQSCIDNDYFVDANESTCQERQEYDD